MKSDPRYFQKFRSLKDNNISSIEALYDESTESYIVLWRHIQRTFNNVQIVRAGDVNVQYDMDTNFEDITPLRIKYHPDIILDVVFSDLDPFVSPFPMYHPSEDNIIRYGSIICLQNNESLAYLSTSGAYYQSGSKQHIVHCSRDLEPGREEWWQVVGCTNDRDAIHGEKIKNGKHIRLFNLVHHHWLHSHGTLSVSGDPNTQEVSGFGGKTFTDLNDDWKICCEGSEDGLWKTGNAVSLFHVNTLKYLCSPGTYFGKDLEVNCNATPVAGAKWFARLT